MTDQVTQAETPSTNAETAPVQETTLEDVYKTYNVESTASSFNAQPTPQPQPQPQPQQFAQPVQEQASIPDPTLDPNGYRQWASQRMQDSNALRVALSAVAGKLNQFEQAAQRQAEEADIKRAVEQVNKHLGDSKLDPDVIEISLGAEARRDPRFLQLWNNRQQNPKAFNEGVKAFASKLGKKFSMRADPQIAENQRALKEATSTKATGTPEESLTERIGKLNGADFERAMAQIRGNSY